MVRREIPVVIPKIGLPFIAKFPIDLEAGDQFIITRELRGSQVPEGEKWTVLGYADSGPIISKKD